MNRIPLAIALLCSPAFAAGDRLPQVNGAEHRHCRTEIVQSLNATLAFRTCPEMVSWFKAVEIARLELAKRPCIKDGRVRSQVNLKCYRPQLLPERQK